MRRSTRAQVGKETVEIAERGWYETPAGNRVDITAAMANCLQRTTLIRPEELDELLRQTPPSPAGRTTTFEVANETTLSAAHHLIRETGYTRTLCLNFASAKNPGGGFLGGSQAQEESLARSSGLYSSLQTQWTYYQANRGCDTALYTDHMILSPDVPVFRDDAGQLLEEPYGLSILTAPAVNAGAIRDNEPHRVSLIAATMAVRISKVLAIAARHDYEHLILGRGAAEYSAMIPTRLLGCSPLLCVMMIAFVTALGRWSLPFLTILLMSASLGRFGDVLLKPPTQS